VHLLLSVVELAALTARQLPFHTVRARKGEHAQACAPG